jgi:hydroxymethylglutaryl-CoA lyase
MTQARQVEIVEVGPRDGYQGIGPFIPTETKIALLERLMEAGLRRIEIGSFVSPKALPQMRDTNEILAACRQWPELKAQVLVPNEKWGREAISAGAKQLVFVLSVSESHNRNNVRRTSTESAEEYGRLLRAIPPDVEIRLDLATSFDCPFEGRIGIERAMALLDRLIDLKPDAEICPCDTTGRADPAQVGDFFETALQRFPEIKAWALHAHDTYGLGLANVHAAYRKGVRIFDASFAGLGGCPFAPGATGNVATEDLVWMFERMGVPTGIDIAALLPVAQDGAKIPGGLIGWPGSRCIERKLRRLRLHSSNVGVCDNIRKAALAQRRREEIICRRQYCRAKPTHLGMLVSRLGTGGFSGVAILAGFSTVTKLSRWFTRCRLR